MPDLRIDTRASPQRPAGGFWTDVAKITLGVCFGTLLASFIAAVLWWSAVGLLVSKAASAVKKAAEAAEDEAILRTNDLIRAYQRIAASDADEADKAAAADRVAAACRRAMDAEQTAVWEANARVHREAAAAGKKTRLSK